MPSMAFSKMPRYLASASRILDVFSSLTRSIAETLRAF
jgi:hypothetical protein